MEVEQQYTVPEPEWILHKTDAGQPLFWRRHGDDDNPRVKFKYDVEIKEFSRHAHELEDLIPSYELQAVNSAMSLGVACLMGVAIMVLPYYILL